MQFPIKKLTATLLAGTLLLAGCSVSPTQTPAYTPTAATVTGGGELIFLQANSPNSFDPHLQNDTASAQANRSIYEGLTGFDNDGNLVGMLAHSWEMITDTIWQFNLRQGVVFHDGTPFNAQAVKINFDRLLNPAAAHPGAFIIEMINHTEVIDDYTIHLHLDFPFSPLPAHLAAMVALIIAPSAIAEQDNGGVLVRDNPIGTAAFYVASFRDGEYTRFHAFDQHWRARPYVDSLLFQVVPDPNVRLMMVEAGEAHVSTASASDVPFIESSPTVNMLQVPGSNLTYIGFNTNVAPFDDVRVRQAISMAIEPQDFVHAVIEGQGVAATGPLAPLVFGSAQDLQGLGHDLDVARELLAQAGFPDGFNATIHASTPDQSRIAELAQAQLQAIGVNLTIHMVEQGAFMELTDNGNHQLFVMGWTAFTGDADYGLWPLFHSNSHGAVGNRTFYANPVVDDLLQRARSSSDQAYRAQLYAQIQQILVNDAPMIWLYHPIATNAYHGITGLVQYPNIVPQFYLAQLVS